MIRTVLKQRGGDRRQTRLQLVFRHRFGLGERDSEENAAA